jgi:hypothetical protein
VTHPVRTAAEAASALTYFNAFHDGLMLELTLRSGDRFVARGVHELSGHLELDILFAHYNYRSGEPPADQRIRARFQVVREVAADFPLGDGEWSIDRLVIEPGTRRHGGAEEPCLVARVHQHCLADGAWRTRVGLAFSFRAAEVEELFG